MHAVDYTKPNVNYYTRYCYAYCDGLSEGFAVIALCDHYSYYIIISTGQKYSHSKNIAMFPEKPLVGKFDRESFRFVISRHSRGRHR